MKIKLPGALYIAFALLLTQPLSVLATTRSNTQANNLTSEIVSKNVVNNYSIDNGYEIKVTIENLKDTTLMLGYHFGHRKYVKDTISLDHSGTGVFKGEESLPGGLYLIVTPDMNFFEILIDSEQHFSLKTSLRDPFEDMIIEGSDELTQFIKYHVFMRNRQAEAGALRQRRNNSEGNPDSLKLIQDQLRVLDNTVQDYWSSIIEASPESLLANMIRTMQNPQIPEFDIPVDHPAYDSLQWTLGYNYNIEHYFDNVDFSDQRLLRTPLLHSKLETFFTRTIEQYPAAIIPQAIKVTDLSKADEEVFRYVLLYLMNLYENSQIMGLDAVFVELAERYFFSGEASWAPADQLARLQERVDQIKPNLIGNVASELKLITNLGNDISLLETEAEAILIYFYEPQCAYCIDATPAINDLYNTYKEKGLKVFGFYIYDDIQEWNQYINSNDLEWIHVFDPLNTSNYRVNYDVYSTPTIYILDSEKRIVAKRIGYDVAAEIVKGMFR